MRLLYLFTETAQAKFRTKVDTPQEDPAHNMGHLISPAQKVLADDKY